MSENMFSHIVIYLVRLECLNEPVNDIHDLEKHSARVKAK